MKIEKKIKRTDKEFSNCNPRKTDSIIALHYFWWGFSLFLFSLKCNSRYAPRKLQSEKFFSRVDSNMCPESRQDGNRFNCRLLTAVNCPVPFRPVFPLIPLFPSLCLTFPSPPFFERWRRHSPIKKRAENRHLFEFALWLTSREIKKSMISLKKNNTHKHGSLYVEDNSGMRKSTKRQQQTWIPQKNETYV